LSHALILSLGLVNAERDCPCMAYRSVSAMR